VFRHFPLTSIHDKAFLAAEAAEAAGAQGKFWEMHDLLFDRQREWASVSEDEARKSLADYAEELGLDVEQFSDDLEKGTYSDQVQQAYDEAVQRGLQGTPSVFIDGQKFNGPLSDFVLDGVIKMLTYDGIQYDAPPEMAIDPEQSYYANVETTKGTFCVELYAEQAPNTVNSFVFLANEGFYDGITFHRVLPDFVAQAGDPTGGGFGGPGYRFDDEIDADLIHDGPGILSMANAGPNTNGSQFFITYRAVPELDGKHAVFGRVEEGMEVVASLMPRDPAQDPYAPADEIIGITIGSSCEM
jgi:cyclophilin family peptidyl-prolyl cis-trans isomerase